MVYKHISIGNENQVLIKTQEVYKCKKKKNMYTNGISKLSKQSNRGAISQFLQ